MASKAERVRAVLEASGRPYSAGAKRSAREYAEERRRDRGVGLGRIASEIGVAPATLKSWLPQAALVPVRVVGVADDSTASSGLSLTDTRRNLRVEGLTLEGLITLLERLQ